MPIRQPRLLLVLLALAACESGTDDQNGAECGATKACPLGFTCAADGHCVADSKVDGGVDARTPDAPLVLDARPATVDAPMSLLDAPRAVDAPSAPTFDAPPPPMIDARPPPMIDAPPPDTTAPSVTLSGTPTDGQLTNVATTDLTWTFDPAEPASSKFECAVDGSASFTQAACKNVAYGDGAHSFAVRGRDAAGNVGAAKSVAFTIDTSKPTATITSADPANGALSRDSSWSLTYTSNEGSVSFACLIDGTQLMSPCPDPINLFDGTHTAQVRATDAAGNVGDYSDAVSYTLRTQGPNLTNIVKPFTHDNPKPFTVSWSADEPATYACTFEHVDNPVDCAGGSYSGMEERGTNLLDVIATDSLGNMSSTSISWQVN